MFLTKEMPQVAEKIEAPPEAEAPAVTPEKGNLSRLIIWLLVASLSSLFVPLLLVSVMLDQYNNELVSEISVLDEQLGIEPEADPQETLLMETLSTMQANLQALQDAQTQMMDVQYDWMGVMAALIDYSSDAIQVTGISQSANRLIISGKGVNEPTIIGYLETLEQSGQFERIVVQSFTRAQATEGHHAPLAEFVVLVEMRSQTDGNSSE